MDPLVKIDAFLITFLTLAPWKSGVTTQEELFRLFNHVIYIDEEIHTDMPLFVAWQEVSLEREYEGIMGFITKYPDDLKTPQSEFERSLRAIQNINAKGLFLLLYGVYGDNLLQARGVMSRVSTLKAFNAVSYTYGAIYTVRQANCLPHGLYVNEQLAQMLGRVNVGALAEYRKGSHSLDILNNVYTVDKTLPPDNLVMACMPHDENVRARVYRHILKTRDLAYAPLLHYMCVMGGTTGKAAYYMAISLGGEFTPLPQAVDSMGTGDILWRWFHGVTTDEELDNNFEEVLRWDESLFKYMVRNNMGLGISCKIRITAKRYMRIMRLAQGQDRTHGLIGPFIIKDSPFIGIKLTRRDYDNGRTKKPD